MSKTIITYSGKEANKDDCRFIKGDYYLIGDPEKKDSGDCYQLTKKDGKSYYYRYNSSLISWDYELERYIVLEDHPEVVKGIVGIKFEKGYFTPNLSKNVIFSTHVHGNSFNEDFDTWVFDESCLDKRSYSESPWNGKFYKVKETPSSVFNIRGRFPMMQKVPYFTVPKPPYNLSNFSDQFLDEITRNSEDYVLSQNFSSDYYELANLLSGLTFGFENESAVGHIPERFLLRYGVLPLRDGSISGHEYTSTVCRGATGIYRLYNFFKTSNNYIRANEFCSLHYHIGNTVSGMNEQDQKLFVLSLYMLYYHLQQEIWEMLPGYKKDPSFFAKKSGNKDHCRNLVSLGFFENQIYDEYGGVNEAELNKNFTELFTFLNDGERPNSKFNYQTRTHRKHGQEKWHIESRYFSLNFYNFFFSNSRTIEFRAHSGTNSADKALAWLLICVGLIKFAKKHKEAIINRDRKYNLSDIVEGFLTNFGELDSPTEFTVRVVSLLKHYINVRKQKFREAFFKGDIYANEFDENMTLCIIGEKGRKIKFINE